MMCRRKTRKYCRTSSGTWASVSSFTMQIGTIPPSYPPSLLVATVRPVIACVVVHPAGIQDRDGAKLVLSKARGLFPRLRLIWADGGYAGKLVEWTLRAC